MFSFEVFIFSYDDFFVFLMIMLFVFLFADKRKKLNFSFRVVKTNHAMENTVCSTAPGKPGI